ncbi:hypothetical protein FKM82_004340 [Ascaphus truei]
MFKNEYQGGAFVDIFSAQGKDPVAKLKLFGSQSAIWKDFDKEVKSFVFVLEGSSQTNKMQLPKENKQMLGLIQRFLILQLYIPLGQDFSAELLITDLANIKRRLYLSTVHKELSATPLHAKIPLFIIKRKVWCNLCIDLVAFTSGIFKGAVFQSLDGIIVSANCKLRKIFTMKLKPQDTVEDDDIYRATLSSNEPADCIPRSCQITTDVHQVTQVLDMTKLRQSETKHEGRPIASSESEQLSNRGQGNSRNNRNQDVSHIAFGSKVLGPPRPTGKKPSARTSAETTRSISRHDRSLHQLSQERGDGSAHATEQRELPLTIVTHPSARRNKENIQQARKKAIHLHDYQPQPPPDPSTPERNNRIRGVGSAEKDRTATTIDSSTLGHCRNEDKLFLQIHMPSCERLNSVQSLNNYSVLQASVNPTDEWIFPDSFPEETSKIAAIEPQTDINNLSEKLADNTQSDTANQGDNFPEDNDDMFTYCSMPRTAPHGKSQGSPLDPNTVSLDDLEQGPRGARMEDDFYGSDSSVEESQSQSFQWTSSPKAGHNTAQCSQPSQRSQSADVSLEDASRSPEYMSTGKSVSSTHKDATSANTRPLTIKAIDFDSLQNNLMPTRSLSPDGGRPEISMENLIRSKTQQAISVNKPRTSMIQKSLREIPKEDGGLTADSPDYDWRNYQASRLSASELQMLASLKRQQNEELEDTGKSHGLSQSQIDHCMVSMSTSSDDTTTSNSCLPPERWCDVAGPQLTRSSPVYRCDSNSSAESSTHSVFAPVGSAAVTSSVSVSPVSRWGIHLLAGSPSLGGLTLEMPP